MNPSTAIKITNVSKQYRLGLVGTGTLSHDLKRWWTMNVLGKEDPNLRVGETNVRDIKGESDYVWALRDINLEIEQGEVVGIIGKNGAGKSTLLKILSRVTKPTTGNITYRGRMGSLLEVGTGFHAEMTGRENIYMNGSIMGMTRHEITRKIDEIIAFSGVERYIDTPVKRYSSGMTVRLGFAVAAHLEPEILVVDEVLAVGDAEFQKKALGKMKDVSKMGGRTVLFVSHNMTAIANICRDCILLENGKVSKIGGAKAVIDYYLKNSLVSKPFFINDSQSIGFKSNVAYLEEAFFKDHNNNRIEAGFINQETQLIIRYRVLEEDVKLNLSVSVYSENDEYLLASPSNTDKTWYNRPHKPGIYEASCLFPSDFFNTKKYFFSILLVRNGVEVIKDYSKIISLEFFEDGINRRGYFGDWNGLVRPTLNWEVYHED